MRLCADPDCVQGATMCRPSLCAHRHYVQILILCSPALCADPHCVQGTTMYRPSFCAGRQLSRDPHPVQTSVVQNSAELAHFRSSAEHGGCLRLWRRCSIVDTALWRPLHYGGRCTMAALLMAALLMAALRMTALLMTALLMAALHMTTLLMAALHYGGAPIAARCTMTTLLMAALPNGAAYGGAAYDDAVL